MTRLGIVLTIALVSCAMGLVASQHRARKLFVELERANAQTRQIEVHWAQLQLEQSGLATAARIDAKARTHLSMQPVAAQRTLYMSVDTTGGTPTERTAMGPVR